MLSHSIVDELCQKLLVSCDKLISEKKTGSAPGRMERFSFREPRPTISGGIPSFLST
jgi:hypothetical protein